MKLHNIIATSLVFLVVFGCWDTETDMNRRDYIIENDTDFPLDVKFYSRTDGKLNGQSSRILNKNERLSKKVELTIDFGSSEDYPRLAYSADSVKVIFNNEKYYTCVYNTSSNTFSEPINRNIFRHSNYTSLGNEQYLFKITRQDYENAQICNGDCE